MKTHVKKIMSFSLFVVLIFSGYFGLLAEEVPMDVFQAAQKGVCNFVNAESSMENSPFGISTKAALDNARLHHGFQVYTVSPVKLLKSTGLSSHLAPTGLWRFVVVSEGQPVSLITIAQVEGQWKAVSMGGAQLANEVNKVMEKWPAKQGYNHSFIRIYQARADFIEISRNGRSIGFVPLTASRLAFGIDGGFDPAVILHDSEILSPLKKIVIEKMNNDKQK